MNNKSIRIEKKYLLPFVLITSLFALWDFATDITNPLVATYQSLMVISNAKASLIQFAFYGEYETMKSSIRILDLIVIRNSYVILGILVIVIFIIIALVKMPFVGSSQNINVKDSFHRLIKNKIYKEYVIVSVFNVAVAIMCWIFIIQYADRIGIKKERAQLYTILAMVIFLTSRFICIYLMNFFDSKKLLLRFAIGGASYVFVTIFLQNLIDLYWLIAVSAFISLMFPTMYGIELENVDKDTALGYAGLMLAIVGGAVLPHLQSVLIDKLNVKFLPAVNVSFIISFTCFIVITCYHFVNKKSLVLNKITR